MTVDFRRLLRGLFSLLRQQRRDLDRLSWSMREIDPEIREVVTRTRLRQSGRSPQRKRARFTGTMEDLPALGRRFLSDLVVEGVEWEQGKARGRMATKVKVLLRGPLPKGKCIRFRLRVAFSADGAEVADVEVPVEARGGVSEVVFSVPLLGPHRQSDSAVEASFRVGARDFGRCEVRYAPEFLLRQCRAEIELCSPNVEVAARALVARIVFPGTNPKITIELAWRVYYRGRCRLQTRNKVSLDQREYRLRLPLTFADLAKRVGGAVGDFESALLVNSRVVARFAAGTRSHIRVSGLEGELRPGADDLAQDPTTIPELAAILQ